MAENFIVRGMGQKKDVTALTGAQRDNQEGKLRFDLIGLHMLKRLARLLAAGAAKYEERNWEKGQEAGRTLASLWRHVVAYQEGDRVEDHLAAIVFNAMSIMHVEEEVKAGRLPKELLTVGFYQYLEEFNPEVAQTSVPDNFLSQYIPPEPEPTQDIDYEDLQAFGKTWKSSLPRAISARFKE